MYGKLPNKKDLLQNKLKVRKITRATLLASLIAPSSLGPHH